MDLIENIKAFFKKKGLKWTGEIITHRKEDFRLAKVEDFEHLSTADYLIDFGEDGRIVLSAEIDEVTFKIHGESFDVCYSCYAGDNEKNLKLIRKLEDKDFSTEFIKFQLETCGLVYATLLRKRCEDEKNKIKERHKTIRTRKENKIQFLQQGIENDYAFEKEELKVFSKIERMAKKYEDSENTEDKIEP